MLGIGTVFVESESRSRSRLFVNPDEDPDPGFHKIKQQAFYSVLRIRIRDPVLLFYPGIRSRKK
jgi:hypothetical protein